MFRAGVLFKNHFRKMLCYWRKMDENTSFSQSPQVPKGEAHHSWRLRTERPYQRLHSELQCTLHFLKKKHNVVILEASLDAQILKFLCTAVLYNYNGSFAFSFYFILSLRQDGMLRKRLTKKDERMRPKMREVHELPSKKLGL